MMMDDQIKKPRAYWHPVALSKSLKRAKPLRIMLGGMAYALFRTTAGGIGCVKDICPHRFARFSEGKVVGGEVQCPYHGCKFNAQGRCTEIPVHNGEVPNRFVKNLAAREQDGLIYVTDDKDSAGEPHQLKWDDQPYVRRIIENKVGTSLVNVAENVLDPTHTLFVHKGLMRGLTDKTSRVTIDVNGNQERIDIKFSGEDVQNGIVSRLLEGKRSYSTGSFELPGIVEIEYWANGKMKLANTLMFSKIDENTTRGFAVLTAPRQFGLGFVKAAVFIPLLKHIIKQDRVMMDMSHENWEANGRPNRAMSPTDFVRPNIEAIMSGITPPAAINPVRIVYEL
ncbi:Rieske 2Fe-2S domain-containing protein [Rhizobium sp. MHM7A]|nr:Rieske 2Fe-2S domain-containing protein [Rhizobium sp. MHM7A]